MKKYKPFRCPDCKNTRQVEEEHPHNGSKMLLECKTCVDYRCDKCNVSRSFDSIKFIAGHHLCYECYHDFEYTNNFRLALIKFIEAKT